MEPPYKRPRLSMFSKHVPDIELDQARYVNDLSLKTRFEAIFAKYSQDFAGVGDEIDILTGTIVVNNGHIEGMANETDTGENDDIADGDQPLSGKSLLHAMTVAPESQDPYFENPVSNEVIMSIETMAENAAALTCEDSMAESEDDLFEIPESRGETRTPDGEYDNYEDKPPNVTKSIIIYSSDEDSLFDCGQTHRSESHDSLFDVPRDESTRRSQSARPDLDSEVTDAAILAKFGADVGQQVLDLLEKRDQGNDAHLEPAWRIPVNIGPTRGIEMPTTATLQSSTERQQVDEPSVSLWRQPQVRKQPPIRLRDRESEDPLQQDFTWQSEDGRELVDDGATSETDDYQVTENDEGNNSSVDDDLDQERSNIESDEEEQRDEETLGNLGLCPYCKQQFSCKTSLMSHWDRLIKKPKSRMSADDPHDMMFIRAARGVKQARVRAPRLTLGDFRTMVELHEGADLSFEDVERSRALRTQKTSAQLQDLYDKHRNVPSDHNPRQTKPWTAEEDQLLQDLCKNSLVTMATLKRLIKGRDEIEIGDKLATGWLRQLRGSSQAFSEFLSNAVLHSQQQMHTTYGAQPSSYDDEVVSEIEQRNSVSVKTESPEEELFDPRGDFPRG